MYGPSARTLREKVLLLLPSIIVLEWKVFHFPDPTVVPFDTRTIVLLGFYPLLVVSGSRDIDARAGNAGITHCFYHFRGAGHSPQMEDNGSINQAYLDTTINVITEFLYGLSCGQAPVCWEAAVGRVNDFSSIKSRIFPNPSSGGTTICFYQKGERDLVLSEINGKILARWHSSDHQFYLPFYTPGIYLLRIQEETGLSSVRIIFE